MEERLQGHLCKVDRKDGKLRFRAYSITTEEVEFTLKLTEKEVLKLIHMLSE